MTHHFGLVVFVAGLSFSALADKVPADKLPIDTPHVVVEKQSQILMVSSQDSGREAHFKLDVRSYRQWNESVTRDGQDVLVPKSEQISTVTRAFAVHVESPAVLPFEQDRVIVTAGADADDVTVDAGPYTHYDVKV